MHFDLNERTSGVLLHPTSLPGPHGNGDLGPEATRFAEALAKASQRWWQMLPVGPLGYGNSPYSAQSAFAGNPLLISLSRLVDDGLLEGADLAGAAHFSEERVDYAAASALRAQSLRRAFESSRRRGHPPRFEQFCARAKSWLPEFALFAALKRAHRDVAWVEWSPELRAREPKALDRARRELAGDVELYRFEQWLFDEQWRALKAHCNERGVALIGDVPIFVAHDSADVWEHREIFHLDADGRPTVVAGVPPDYFSATGQRWGNPLYDWELLARRGYDWWVARMASALERFDAIRLDHFIGFVRSWNIPGGEPTAQNGTWVPGPGRALFEAVRRAHGSLPLIAEDLGLVTPEVLQLRDELEFPGIKILQFAFGTDPMGPSFLPHNYPRRAAAYTGTHDNDTTVGWFNEQGGGTRSPAQAGTERRTTLEYLGSSGREIHWEMIRAVWASVANVAIAPMQDLLGLGTEARMNLPGTIEHNWEWRMRPGALTTEIVERLGHLTRTYGRAPARSAA